MRLLAKTRSVLAVLGVLGYVGVFGALVLYLGIYPLGWILPARRRALVGWFMRLMSWGILGGARLGGARLERAGTVPTDGPVLVLMNHQSLLDICTLTLMSWPAVPAFVTRKRYGYGVPVISACVRGIGSPIIEPERDPRAAVDLLRASAPTLTSGVVLFAEGHRSKDGALRAFRSAGVEALMAVHPMPVWVVATDGFWTSRTLNDVLFNVDNIQGRTEVLGRLDPPAPGADVKPLVAQARELIAQRITEMRADPDSPPPALVPAALVEAIRARVTEAPAPEAVRAARALAEAGDGQLEAVVFFGSRMTNAQPGAGSALDFFAVASDERRLYEGWKRAGLVKRSPALLAALGHVLPPTSVALNLPDGDGGELFCKVAVSGAAAFRRATSLRHRDHFTLGRLFQRTSLVYARDAAAEERALRALARAHVLTYRWARPWLPEGFDAEAYAQALLRVSFAGEIRPEPVAARVATLWQAQQDYLRPVYGVLLEALAARGDLRRLEDGRFALRRPVARRERLRRSLYFRFSMARATARWGKHVLSFDGWLDFLVRKARRHTGEDIVLSPRERRAPLIFLWPRVWRYLRHKDRQSP